MTSSSWLLWAVLSAIFAAATAIFAKVGVGGLNSDLATLIRTAVWQWTGRPLPDLPGGA